jgi:hexosaminidase
MTPIKKVYETKPHFGSIFVPDGCDPLGFEAAIWCEHITKEEELERRLFPRIYALAEIAWSDAEDY